MSREPVDPRPASGPDTAPTQSRSAGPPALPLDHADFASLSGAIGEVAGQEAADDVLFRLGRRLGQESAGRIPVGGSAEERLRSALADLDQQGFGGVSVESVRLEHGKDCLVSGRTCWASGSGPGPKEPADGALCGLTVGYITGLTASLSGLDVVCSPFRCRMPCDLQRCTFEVRPAHLESSDEREGAPPAGAARFFLDTMGRGIGEADISLSALLENNSDAIILIDSGNAIRFWNEGAERMFQYPREEVVGLQAGFILPADLREKDELGRIQKRLEAGKPLENFHTRRVRRDGTELWVSLTRTVLRDSQGRSVGSTAVLRDISKQRRAEEELNQVRTLALVGELAAKVAHEVKNPLAGIYAAIQLLARGCEEEDPRREVLDEVMKEIRRLDLTILELLNFARPAPPKPVPTDLQSFVGNTIESLRRHPQVEPHRIEVEIETGIIVDCDTRLLGQVFDNLVLNAGQAMSTPGVISIQAWPDGARVRVEVRDEGPGISEEQMDRIFEPFHTTKVRGTGLGLCIARKNSEVHGGELEARNAEQGAIFTFSLPQSQDLHFDG